MANEGWGIFEFYGLYAEKVQGCVTPTWVRPKAPPGLGAVQTFSGRHLNIGPDGTVEMSAEDGEYLIRAGWTKLAEWKTVENT
jgi:hypothetical protein